jgi:oxalate decarboxylase
MPTRIHRNGHAGQPRDWTLQPEHHHRRSFLRAAGAAPYRSNRSGNVRIADSRSFKVSTTVAAALETIKPGAIREMHWHPNADEWDYWIKGQGRMTVFNTGPRAATMDFRAGDIGVVKKNFGHYIQNTGTTDAHFLAVFKTAQYEEVSLSDWLTHTPPEPVAQHLNIDAAVVRQFPNNARDFCRSDQANAT